MVVEGRRSCLVAAGRLLQAHAHHHLINTEKGETRDQAIWRLQQQVHLRVLERFEYLVEDASAGIRIEVIGEE